MSSLNYLVICLFDPFYLLLFIYWFV